MAAPLILRADGSSQMGTGHVMRCLALAQGWQDSGDGGIFVMGTQAPALEARLGAEGMEVVHMEAQAGSEEDAIRTAALARQVSAPWVVVDGYHFGARYQEILKERGLRVLFIDDHAHAEHYYADLVLNQNIHAREPLYTKRESYTQLLLGTRYVLLRREFLRWREWKRHVPHLARKVLVTMGGADPNCVTLKAIQALRQVQLPGLEVTVVIGPANEHCERQRQEVNSTAASFHFLQSVTTMSDLMAWADAAIAAAGSTSWELAFMGVPALLLVLAQNQALAAQECAARNLFRYLATGSSSTPDQLVAEINELLKNQAQRQKLSDDSRLLVDGLGAARVVRSLRSAS